MARGSELILRVVEFALALAVLWGLVAGYRATHVPRYRLALTPADVHLPYETLSLMTQDGTRLAAWLLLPASPKGVVIVQHGYGTCRADPLLLTALVFRGGYAVLSMDFRGHGESQGRCTFGKLERLDIKAALDAIGRDARLAGLAVGYLGISMGGAVGILTAAEDPRIAAVVSDSVYARLQPMVARYQWLTYRIPETLFGWISACCLSMELMIPLSKLDPVRAIGRVAPRPVLIIHGEQDLSVPVSHARELYAAAGEPKSLWIVPEAGHVASVYYAEQEYASKVLAFLERGLTRS